MNASINLSWTTSNANYDYFQIWRYKADENTINDWEFINFAFNKNFTDSFSMINIPYYYAVVPIYQGKYGSPYISDSVTLQGLKANIYLHSMTYLSGNISLPATFTLDVWNNGNTSINNYEIGIAAYDLVNKKIIFIDTPTASSLNAILPLQSGYRQTLSFQLNYLPGTWPKYYYWIICLNPNEKFSEEYTDDNYLISQQYWYIASQLHAPSKSISLYPMNNVIGYSDPYYIPNSSKQKKSVNGLDSGQQKIIYKKPEFCVNKYHSD